MRIKNIFLILMVMFLFSSCADKKSISTPKPIVEVSSHTIQQKEQKITILAVGDNLIHDTIYLQAKKRANGNGFDFDYAYEKIADIVGDADISVINQETQLASKILPVSSYPRFNSPIEVGKRMVELGFDVFSQANNHSYDMGADGLQATLDFWDTQQNIIFCGAFRNQQEKEEIKFVESNGLRVAFIACAEYTNGLTLSEGAPQGIIMTSEREFLQQKIHKANEEFDLVVVCVHWGDEGSSSANEEQKSLAKDMVNWGADFIIGNHPHVLQENEYITRVDGTKGFVVYSLGNFISAQSMPRNLASEILKVEFTFGKNSKPSISNVTFTPIVTHYGSAMSNLQIIPFEEYTPELANIHGVKEEYPEFNYEYFREIFEKYK